MENLKIHENKPPLSALMRRGREQRAAHEGVGVAGIVLSYLFHISLLFIDMSGN